MKLRLERQNNQSQEMNLAMFSKKSEQQRTLKGRAGEEENKRGGVERRGEGERRRTERGGQEEWGRKERIWLVAKMRWVAWEGKAEKREGQKMPFQTCSLKKWHGPKFNLWPSYGQRSPDMYLFIFMYLKSEARGSGWNLQTSPVPDRLTTWRKRSLLNQFNTSSQLRTNNDKEAHIEMKESPHSEEGKHVPSLQPKPQNERKNPGIKTPPPCFLALWTQWTRRTQRLWAPPTRNPHFLAQKGPLTSGS